MIQGLRQHHPQRALFHDLRTVIGKILGPDGYCLEAFLAFWEVQEPSALLKLVEEPSSLCAWEIETQGERIP